MTLDPPAGPPDAGAPPPPSAARATRGPTPGPLEVRFTGDGGTYFGILFVNGLLTFLTLGIYYAWGRVRELAFLIGNVVVDGDPMSFHGRGGELFRGVLLMFFLVLLPLYALLLAASLTENSGMSALLLLVVYAGVGVLVLLVSVGSLRYRLARTEWRGIRFGFDGRPWRFVAECLPRLLAVVVSFGLYYPVYACWRRQWILERCRFGTEHFACAATPGELYPSFILCWLAAPFTLGVSLAWYQGKQQAVLWNASRLGAARFRCTITGQDWLLLQLTNLLLVLFTLGIGSAWAIVRVHRYVLGALSLDGNLDLEAIRQQLQRGGAAAEGALDLLDADTGLDLG